MRMTKMILKMKMMRRRMMKMLVRVARQVLVQKPILEEDKESIYVAITTTQF